MTPRQVRGHLGAGREHGGGGAAHRQGQVSGRALGEPAAIPLPRTRLLVIQHIALHCHCLKSILKPSIKLEMKEEDEERGYELRMSKTY